MAKHNYKKKYMASLINKKKQLKLEGRNIDVSDIELLEIPQISVEQPNLNRQSSFFGARGAALNPNDLVKKVPDPKFKKHKKLRLVDATADTIVDMPFTETYQGSFDDKRRADMEIVLTTDENRTNGQT